MNHHYKILFSAFLIIFSFSNSKLFSQLNGTYSIGPGGDYITIISAVNDVVSNGVTGPVVFNIFSGTYDEQPTIDSIPGASHVNTVTFQSQTGNPDEVILRNPDFINQHFVLALNKADYITFKNISFLYPIVFNDHVINMYNNCDGISFINNKITLNSPSANSHAINLTNAITKNLIINGNTISAPRSVGIAAVGTFKSTGTQIINNHINCRQGMNIRNHDSLFIENNEISVTDLDYEIHAVELSDCGKYLKIFKNRIFSQVMHPSRTSNGIIIQNSICQNSLIANNFVYYSGGQGLYVLNSTNINIYFNTIYSPGYNPFLWNTNLNLINCSDCNVKNNIQVGREVDYNNQSNPSLSSDYNCFYPADSLPIIPHLYLLLYFNGTGYSDIEPFRIASNNDFNSKVRKVFFASSLDLHLAGTSIGDMNLKGIAIPGITDDIDGNPRNPTSPYKGADEADVPLPIELNSFSSMITGRDVLLNWSTSGEINNSGFNIERLIVKAESSDNWQSIGFVNGNGTINSPKNYSFKDISLNSGSYKYRLKQIDFNGNFEYFYLGNDVIIDIPEKFSLSQNFPNPFNPITKINYDLPVSSFVKMKLYNSLGIEVENIVNENKHAGYYTVELNGANLSSGIYFYAMEAANFREYKKINSDKVVSIESA